MIFFKRQHKAFTLIETAIVLFIISLLMLLILPNLNTQRKKAVATHAAAMVSTIQSQIDLYLNEHPDDKTLTYSDLVAAGYVSTKQVQKAKELHITLDHNEAHQ